MTTTTGSTPTPPIPQPVPRPEPGQPWPTPAPLPRPPTFTTGARRGAPGQHGTASPGSVPAAAPSAVPMRGVTADGAPAFEWLADEQSAPQRWLAERPRPDGSVELLAVLHDARLVAAWQGLPGVVVVPLRGSS